MRFFSAAAVLLQALTSASSDKFAARRLHRAIKSGPLLGVSEHLRGSPSKSKNGVPGHLSVKNALSVGDDSFFHPLTCNDGISEIDCDPGSENYLGSLSTLLADTTEGEQVLIPCGKCVNVDTTDGSTLSFTSGLDIQGMLYFPSSANVALTATHIFVQGVLMMLPPTTADDNKVQIKMVGTEDQYLFPHEDNAAMCDEATGCAFGKKAIVVAGGRLDIRGLEDEACPAWTKLQSVVAGVGPPADDPDGCADDQDLTYDGGDGTFESFAVEVDPEDSETWIEKYWCDTCMFAVEQDDDGNKYLSQKERTAKESGLVLKYDMGCAIEGGQYIFTFRYRVHGGQETSGTWSPYVQVKPAGGNSRCPQAISNEWVTCTIDYTMRKVDIWNGDTKRTEMELQLTMDIDPSQDIDYDDFSYKAVTDYITVEDSEAVGCWRPNDEVLITNSESEGGWQNQVVKTIQSVDPDSGKISYGQANPIGNPISLDDDSFDSRMASEVAWLSRRIIFDAEGDTPEEGFTSIEGIDIHGGHLIVFKTPDVAQHIEGVEIRNFGQQGELGRYPIHFHGSYSVEGSVVRKNVIRESKQRCVVIHGTHNVMVEENVAYDTYGHCYMLEDGGEMDNTFQYNFGAKTRNVIEAHVLSDEFSDDEASTFWITNPKNHFIGNVAAGAAFTGIWIELEAIRGGSANLTENVGVNPINLPLYTFKDNVAHSNAAKGISTYFPGYRPEEDAIFEGSIVHHNKIGLLMHGNERNRITNSFFALNEVGLQNFANFVFNTVEDSEFVGECSQDGIQISLEGRSSQLKVYRSTFEGYNSDCGEEKFGALLAITNEQANRIYAMPILEGLSFPDLMVAAVNITLPFEDMNIFIQDPDGTMNPPGSSGYQSPGFFVNNVAHMTAFIDDDLCSEVPNTSGMFCKEVCLRRMLVEAGGDGFKSVQTDDEGVEYTISLEEAKANPLVSPEYQMVVTSKTSTKSHTFDKYLSKEGLWYNNNSFDVVLPADEYNVYFIRISDGEKMIPDDYVVTFADETDGDDLPTCADFVTADDLDFAAPAEDKYSILVEK